MQNKLSYFNSMKFTGDHKEMRNPICGRLK